MIARAVTTELPERSPAVRFPLAGRPVLTYALPAVVVGGVLAVAGAAMSYAVRANTWAVMTDEVQVARLAISIGDEHSLVPTIRGAYYGAHNQLYPLLLAPFYATLDAPAAATAAHALNALLLVSAGVPAFLLARAVAGTNGAGYVAAALTAVSPWLVLSSTLLTENAAYAAFTWSVFLCHRAIVRPSARGDAAALAGLALAFLARTQLVVLVLALPAALVLHAIGLSARRGPGFAAVRRGVVRTIAEHRLLVYAYAAGAVGLALLAVAGALGGVVGNYAVPFEGDLLPPEFWRFAAAHFDQVALGAGILPVVLSASWLVTTAVHPEREEGHAYAALLLVTVPLLTFEVTSFDLRFSPGQFIQDRYLMYLVPLFAVGCAAWLTQRTHTAARALSAVGAALALVLLLRLTPDEDEIVFWAAPAAAFRPALVDSASWLGLSEIAFLQIATVVSVLVVIPLAWRAPRVALVGAGLALAAFGAVQAGYVFDRFVEPALVRQDVAERDWIDGAVPGKQSVALVPGGAHAPTPWWEAEFWNKDVDRALRVDMRPTFTPFPVDDVSVDDVAGRLSGPQPSDYLVLAHSETRLGFVETAEVAADASLRVVRVPRPYRLSWTTRGLTTDGWTRELRPVTIRLFGLGAPVRRSVTLTLAASARSPRPFGFVLTGGGDFVRGTVAPGGARPPVELTVCVPRRGYVDLRLRTYGSVREDGGVVSLHVQELAVSDPWPCTAT
jgi:hypothetical protein